MEEEIPKKDELVGTEFAGCEIISKIGAGGMASAYKARHLGLDKIVCIKILSQELAAIPRNIDFFLREARSIAKLEHPNIVQVYNVGKENDIHYIVMSYIEGKSLADIVEKEGPLGIDKATKIMQNILRGLNAAHKKQIIHRDIKPSNILITKNGQPKIVDFGLAKGVSDDKTLTVAGEMVGTAYFMAPEQCLGKEVDSRTDLYAAGVTYYYLLTGKYPYEGRNSIEVMQNHINKPVADINRINSKIPLHISGAIKKLLAKKPEDRFQTAEEVLSALEGKDKIAEKKEEPKTIKEKDSSVKSLKIKSVEPETVKPAKPKTELIESYEELLKKDSSKNKTKDVKLFVPPPTDDFVYKPKKKLKADIKTEKKKHKIKKLEDIFKNSLPGFAFAFLLILNITDWFYLGRISAKTANFEVEGIKLLLSPWAFSGYGTEQIVLLLCGIIFTIILFSVLNKKEKSLLSIIALVLIALSSYSLALLDIDKSWTAILGNAFGKLFAKDNFLIYSLVSAAAGLKILSFTDRNSSMRMASSTLMALACIFIWVFAGSIYSGGDAMNVLVFLAAAFLMIALVFNFFPKIYFADGGGISAVFILAMLLFWMHPLSKKVDSFTVELEATQELAISNASIKKQLAKDFGNKKKAAAIVIPERKPLSRIRLKAWKTVFIKPFQTFLSNAAKNSSFMLILLISFVYIVSFFTAVYRKENY